MVLAAAAGLSCVLLCFVADDMTGIPHAVMGMHKVIQVS